jgi:hypothetical protein
MVAAGLVVVIIAVGVGAVADPFGGGGSRAAGVADNGAPTSLATVRRQTLTAQTQFTATLGYAGSYTVVSQGAASVIFTALPRVGETVPQGHVLYRVDGAPVVLLYGSTPAYRTLSEGTTGADVAELNADLVELGYAPRSGLDPRSDTFSWETAVALEKLQAHLGVTATGILRLGQAVFLPTAARVTSLLVTLGAPAQSGDAVLEATSTRRQVSIALDPADQAEVRVEDPVTITLPDNRSTVGVVSSVGQVAGIVSSASSQPSGSASGPTPTITVLVRPSHPRATGSWDQAPVTVTIAARTVRHVLAVPVVALLALSGGRYAVEVASPGGVHHLVPVSLGLFDDAAGRVQVSGSGLRTGQRVVVPVL